jgi:O-antigen/teichoic acid export membrane protein
MDLGLGEKLRRNTRSSIFVSLFDRAIRFLMVPIIIGYVGYQGYGLIGLAFKFLGFFTIYNMGVNVAYTKYTAECYVSGDHERLNRILSTGNALGILVAIATMLVAVVFLEPLLAVLNLDRSSVESLAYYEDAKVLVLCVAVVSGVTLAFGIYRAALGGIQRIDLINYNYTVLTIVEFVFVYLMLRLGFGVRTVVLAYAGKAILSTVVFALYLRHYLPELSVNPLRAQLRYVWEIFSVGGKMHIAGLFGLLVSSVDALLIQRYQGLAFVGAYLIARNLSEKLQGPLRGFFGVLAPASADLHARRDYDRISRLFITSLRITAIAAVFIYGYIAINSDLLAMAYLGTADSENMMLVAKALPLLSVAFLIHTLTGPGSAMLRGIARPWLEMSYQILTIVVAVVLLSITERLGGGEAVVYMFPLALLLASLYFIAVSNKYFRIHWVEPFRSVGLLMLLSPVLTWALRWVWNRLPLGLEEGRLSSLFAFVGMGCVYAVLYAFGVWFLPGLDQGEKEQLLIMVPYGKRVKTWFARPKHVSVP